jgi:16S rRNA (guanine527-N7)-methyltransferase
MREFLNKCIAELNVNLSQEKIDKLLNYMQLVLMQNKLHNLTSITDEKDFIIKHITDSLTIAKYIPDDYNKFIDIGSGAGFHGIPVRIVKDNLDCTIVDSTKKKTDFITEAVSRLKLDNTHIICARAEELSHSCEHRECYDIAAARAVASMPALVELCTPFVRHGGIFIAMKGKDVENADNAIKKTGAEIKTVSKIILPFSDYERNIIIIKKIKSTPQIYPRKYSAIKSRPL